MGWIAAWKGAVVALDTAPVIYFIEQNPKYLALVRSFFAALDKGELRAVTSTLTVLEVLILPLRTGATAIADQYRQILTQSPGLQTLPVSLDIAEQAAILRSRYTLKTPDAIQLATALRGGASAILTNDLRWPSVPGLTIIVLDTLVHSSAP